MPYLFALLIAQVMVGINIVGSKYLLANMSPVIILSIRFLVATLLLLGIHFLVTSRRKNKNRNTLKLRELTKRDWIFIIAQALTAGILFNFLMLLGLHYTNANIAGIITSSLPALIAIMSIIFLRERMTKFSMMCILFAVVGLVVVNARSFSLGNAQELIGVVILLVAMIPEAAYYVLVKVHVSRLPLFLISALGQSKGEWFNCGSNDRSYANSHTLYSLVVS